MPRYNMYDILRIIFSIITLQFLFNALKTRWNETFREKWGRLLRKVPFVESEYQKYLKKETDHAVYQTKIRWAEFGEPITEIPEKGWTLDKVFDLLNKYNNITTTPLKNTHTSGAIYTNTFVNTTDNNDHQTIYANIIKEHFDNHIKNSIKSTNLLELSDSEYFDYITKLSETVSTIAFMMANKWNPLHDEFKIGAFIEEQVIAMVANIVGGNINDTSGVMTNGGSESLMLMMRCYRNWGMEKKNLDPGEPIILAASSVHAAVYKGGEAYNIRVIEINTDLEGRLDINHLAYLLNKYNKYVVAIIGSCPSYPTGVIDPIEEMAHLAFTYNVGFHVDCCLGGFIIQNEFLKFCGVTSMSIDTHKFGLAAKGSSVLLCKKIDDEFVNYYGIYAVPYWRGGLYGTTRDSGSYSAANALIAFVTMLVIGMEGYMRQSNVLLSTTKALADIINTFPEKLLLVDLPQSHMITIKINSSWINKQGAIYAFADEMKIRKFLLSRISNDMVHFCLTVRFASDPNGLHSFENAVKDSLDALEVRDKMGEVFSGIGGYGTLEYSRKPTLESVNKLTTIIKFVQNWFLGTMGAKDAVRKVIMSQHFHNCL